MRHLASLHFSFMSISDLQLPLPLIIVVLVYFLVQHSCVRGVTTLLAAHNVSYRPARCLLQQRP